MNERRGRREFKQKLSEGRVVHDHGLGGPECDPSISQRFVLGMNASADG